MDLTFTHVLFIVIVLAGSFAPGWYISRQIKSADDYSVGGRSANTVMVAGALLATIVGGAATVGTAQMAFRFGLTAVLFSLGSALAMVCMALFYAGPLRESGFTTVTEYLVASYGPWAGPLASIVASLGIFFSIVSSTLTVFSLVKCIFQLDNIPTCLLILFIVLSFVFFGGLKGSSLSGLYKIVVLYFTLFTAGVLAYSYFEGLAGMHAIFPDFPWFSIAGNGYDMALYSLVSLVVGVLCTQSYAQAVFSASDKATAIRGCLLTAVLVVPVGVLCVLIGMYMRHAQPDINPIYALPLFCSTYLPQWVGGAAIAGIILSGISSMASLALGCGTMLSRDIFHGLLGVTSSGKLLWINRLAVLGITVLALGFVLTHLNSYVLTWNYFSMALRGAGVFLPFTFCFIFRDKLHHGLGIASMVAGVAVALLWQNFFPAARQTLLQGLIANLIFLVPAVYFGRSKKQEK